MIELIPLQKNRIRLNFTGVQKPNGSYRVTFTKETAINFVRHLESYCGEQIEPQPAAYNEEISTYKNHVERSIYLSKSPKRELIIYLTCYTNQSDDNWIELTERRLKYLISLLKGYVLHAFN